jgi:predicted CoA-substrate-specific enzyme activase
MNDKVYLGVDIGSVSVNTVILGDDGRLIAGDYRRSRGQVIAAIKDGMSWAKAAIPEGSIIAGCGTTGSGRELAKALLGADVVKNEISAHAAGAVDYRPDVGTVFEIGGEDSKIIIFENGVPTDFAMNTLCAAGTGAFLDQMAARLDIPIDSLGDMALRAAGEARISGRCTVFAESDMIFKQQAGVPVDDIVKGLCKSMVRNYLGDVGQGKKIREPILFQGGVAANRGILEAFRNELGKPVTVPPNFGVMGAIGIALLTKAEMETSGKKSAMHPFDEIAASQFRTTAFSCDGCANDCEIVRFEKDGKSTRCRGGRCGKWELPTHG